eukprot:TRINITY_DN16089_c1_g2_i1.p1 TRINITY_DN16089_c1_g2~~TRINITY_DN16089_c1_g2_i1.p1  ORF type:complete len:744 (+),score=54.73 TRINITY_DN16089_c1_g2_i1:315-2234(+)
MVLSAWHAVTLSQVGPFWKLSGGPFYVEGITLFVRSVCIAQALMHIYVCKCSRVRACFRYSWLEKCVVALILSTELAVLDRFYIAKMLGYSNPQAIYAPFGDSVLPVRITDSFILLQFCMLLSISHIAVPIRWYAMIVVQISIPIVYGCCLWWSDEGRKPQIIAYLIVLVLLTSYGKRQAEVNERLLFSALQTEKSLRMKAEFDLSKARDVSGHEDSTSNAGTTCTGEAFACLDTRKDSLLSLQALVNIGKREQWLLNETELSINPTACLGSGGFGLVFEGTFNGSPAALKLNKSSGFDADLFAISNELRIMRKLRHPNIVLLHGACLSATHNDLVLVMEKVVGTLLTTYIQRQPVEAQRCQVMKGICLGLMYLHTREPVVTHGDLKPSNVMIEQRGEECHAKLLDFGLARLLKRGVSMRGGSYRWLAPEMLIDRRPSAEGDIYSFGLLLFFVCTSEVPFKHLKEAALKARSRHRDATALEIRWPNPISRLAKRCTPIVELATHEAPAQRPSASQLHAKLTWTESAHVHPRSDSPEELWEMVAYARQLRTTKARSEYQSDALQWAASLTYVGRLLYARVGEMASRTHSNTRRTSTTMLSAPFKMLLMRAMLLKNLQIFMEQLLAKCFCTRTWRQRRNSR